MKTLAAVTAALAIFVSAAVVHAGVVVNEQQVVEEPNGSNITRNRVVMIQGDQQKSVIDNGARTVITDLDKGTMTMVDAARKSYLQFPFPPRGRMAAMQGNVPPTISFQKSNTQEKVLGYSCDVYTGAGRVGANEVSMRGCFSSSAPGAADFTAFQHQMREKVKGTEMANMGQFPDGIPLKLTVTTKIGHIPTSGMSPEQAEKLNRMLANREFVTHTTVNKISTEKLASDTFEIPSGYHQQQLPPMMPKGSAGTRQGAAPGTK